MSKLWVGIFSGSNSNFVSPLIESLRHEMTLNEKITIEGLPKYSLKETIRRASDKTIKIPTFPNGISPTKDKNTVRSVQRITNPTKKTAEWVASPHWGSCV